MNAMVRATLANGRRNIKGGNITGLWPDISTDYAIQVAGVNLRKAFKFPSIRVAY